MDAQPHAAPDARPDLVILQRDGGLEYKEYGGGGGVDHGALMPSAQVKVHRATAGSPATSHRPPHAPRHSTPNPILLQTLPPHQ